MTAVRLSDPARRMTQYPHELSGSMRQRVLIATALDVTVRREVLGLLRDLQQTQGTSILLITHDMGVVAEMADRVIIMRNGRIEEADDVR